MRRVFALTLILVGVGIAIFFGMSPTGPDQSAVDHVAVQTQRAEVQRIEKGQQLHECGGTLMRVPSQHTVMPVHQGVTEKVLDSGVVGHFPYTGPVGVGNYALTAHVVTHGEPFAKIPDLPMGAKVLIQKCGTTYTFTVDKKFTVYYKDISVLKNHPKMLTLVTCASRLFHTDYRTVVRGHLTATRR